MNIQELEDKHRRIGLKFQCDTTPNKQHVKISIEFAINVLEEFTTQYCECGRIDDNITVENKIQELKSYLNENKT